MNLYSESYQAKETLFPSSKRYLEMGTVVHACNPSTREAQAEESEVPGQPKLYNKFWGNYTATPCLKKKMS
jgi:hypothetical protein